MKMTAAQKVLKKARYNRYKNNPEFREDAKRRAKKWAKANPEKYKAMAKARAAKITPERRRRYSLRHMYGLELEQVDQMYIEQGGECAICQNLFKVPCVDHDHGTGVVRGLLCKPCNHAIGLLKDSPVLCMWAAKYLVNHGKPL